MEGQNGKWPEILGSPVSPITDGKVEAEREEKFSEITRRDRARMDPRSLTSSTLDHLLWLPVPQLFLGLLRPISQH